MTKRVFFSFHYQDVIDFRANVVRKSCEVRPDTESVGFFDASIWESAKKEGDIALKRLINASIKGTSTTCVLIGDFTYQRRWVRYEIMRSLQKNHFILGVHINSIQGKNGVGKKIGKNPLDYLGVKFSLPGEKANIYELNQNKWEPYIELESRSDFYLEKMPREGQKNKFYKLSELFKTYDWVRDNGYINFPKWIET
ncbi:MAG: TIR domain-containing protein [Planktothrix sp.]